MRMLSVRDLPEKGIKWHPGHLSRLIKQGRFPRPIKLAGGTAGPNAWPEEVIDQWLRDRIAAAAAPQGA